MAFIPDANTPDPERIVSSDPKPSVFPIDLIQSKRYLLAYISKHLRLLYRTLELSKSSCLDSIRNAPLDWSQLQSQL